MGHGYESNWSALRMLLIQLKSSTDMFHPQYLRLFHMQLKVDFISSALIYDRLPELACATPEQALSCKFAIFVLLRQDGANQPTRKHEYRYRLLTRKRIHGYMRPAGLQ